MNYMAKKQLFLSVALSLIGLAVWIIIGRTTNEVEAWDSAYYYQVGLPIMFAASAFAGFIAPNKPWRWGVFVVILQPIVLLTQSQPSPYAAIGVFFFLVFMAMAIGCAYIGKTIRSSIKQ
jgi:hypothetical protein